MKLTIKPAPSGITSGNMFSAPEYPGEGAYYLPDPYGNGGGDQIAFVKNGSVTTACLPLGFPIEDDDEVASDKHAVDESVSQDFVLRLIAVARGDAKQIAGLVGHDQ